jgi:hypothetical protein
MAQTPQLPPTRLAHHPNWASTLWERVIAAANRLEPRVSQAALAGLSHAFPPELQAQLEDQRHPVVAKQLTHAGRSRLLELGLAIVALPASAEDIARLRDPNEFPGCAAELIAGLMFRRQRVKLVRPPKIRGKKRCEYIGAFRDAQCYAIEVKHLEWSEELSELEPALGSLTLELMQRMSWLSEKLRSELPSGLACFQLSDAIRNLGNRSAVDFEEIRSRCHAASDYLQGQLAGSIRFGTFELEGLGRVVIRPDPNPPALGLEFRGPSGDAGRDDRRVRRVVNGAMRQIQETNLPGIIVLDIERDGQARNSLGFLQRWAARKEGLAAVLVMERHSFAGDYSCAAVDVLPGRAFDAASDNVLSLVELCDDEHFHYTPLNRLVSPCPLAAWLS